MGKTKLLLCCMFITFLTYGCATKSDVAKPSTSKEMDSAPKYTISLPFTSANINKIKFHPIKEVLNSINYTYSSSDDFFDSNLAVLLPKQKNANLLLVKLNEDNITILVLLSLKDNGEEKVFPVYTTVNNASSFFPSGDIEFVNMTTVIDEEYNIVITSHVKVKGEEITEVLKSRIDENGDIIMEDNKPAKSS